MNHAISHVSQSRTVRLISNANHKPPVLLALASTHGALENLEALESLTSRRQEAQQKGIPGIALGALATGYGYSFVSAAFAYTRPNGNRFNPPDWGVWYSAFLHDTALQEVAYHLTRAIAAAGARFDNETRYIELLADVDADFVDLRDIDPESDCLNADPAIGYPAGQKLAGEVRTQGCNGIVSLGSTSRRRVPGSVLAGADSEFSAGRHLDPDMGGQPDADNHQGLTRSGIMRAPDAVQRHKRVYARLRRAMALRGVVRC